MEKVYVVIGQGHNNWCEDGEGYRDIFGVYPTEELAREKIAELICHRVYQAFYNGVPDPNGVYWHTSYFCDTESFHIEVWLIENSVSEDSSREYIYEDNWDSEDYDPEWVKAEQERLGISGRYDHASERRM